MRSDEGLVCDTVFERLAQGDQDAVEEICARYGQRVTRMVRRRLGAALRAHVETADISQDAMVEILRTAPQSRFRSETEFLRWVTVVVEHRVLSAAKYWRAARRKGNPLPLTQVSSPDRRVERPSQLVVRREEVERLCLTLAELPSLERQIIIARVLLALSWDDIAASLEMNKAAAQMRFTRARRHLRKRLR